MLKTKNTILISIIFTILIIIMLIFYFNSTTYIYKKISPKGSVITEDILFKDLNYMKKIESIFQDKEKDVFSVKIISNEKLYKEEYFTFTDKFSLIKSGSIINLNYIINKPYNGKYKTPLEIRLSVRVYLYIKERKINDIIGICGYFTRTTYETFIREPNRPFKIGIEELDNIYNSIPNINKYSVNKQVDLITNKWIEQTMYFRPNLNGYKMRPLEGLTPKEKLYLTCRDIYYDLDGGPKAWQIITDLYNNENVGEMLEGKQKELMDKVLKFSSEYINYKNEEKAFFYNGGSMPGKTVIESDNPLKEIFYGKTLTETMQMFK